MYADVVVLTYQSPDINHFTYFIPQNLEKEIKVGQLVEVPFGSRTPMGIVLSIVNRQSAIVKNIKPISSIIIKQPILLPYQIELLKWMSFYYLAPMVNCLEAMLPTAALKAKRLMTNASGWQSDMKLSRGEDTFERVDHSIARSARTFGGLKGHLSASEKVSEQKRVRQSIVLVPTINRIPQTLAQFPKAKNYTLYHNELKPNEKFAAWLKILSGQVDYVFGSRSAVFAPCPNLGEIVIFDEHDHAYKDERSPYFDTLTVAEKIARYTKAKIQILDSSPRISTYFNLGKNITFSTPKVKAEIVSMKEEKLAGNFSPISDFLLTQLKTSQNSLLFLNKKKESGSLFCKSCKNHVFLETASAICPECKSPDFYFNVLNINSLAKELQKLIPKNKVPTIEIATASIFYSQHIKKYDLVAHIQTDSLINQADFSSAEKLYAQIVSLKSLLKPSGILILQTHDQYNLILKTAADSNYQAYFAQQLKLRKALSYPPFALLVKLTIKGKGKEKLESSAQNLADSLRSTINDKRLTILGPYSPIFFSKQTTYSIILKYRLESYSLEQRQEAIKVLLPALKKVDRAFQITVEPESIN